MGLAVESKTLTSSSACNSHRETAAAGFEGGVGDIARVRTRDLAHDGEPQAEAALRAACAGGTIERLEDPLALAWRDAGAAILDDDLRLLEMGEFGVCRLAAVLMDPSPPVSVLAVAATISLWPEGDSLDRVQVLARESAAAPELQFAVAAAFLERGNEQAADHRARS